MIEIGDDPGDRGGRVDRVERLPGLAIAGIASIGAGCIHAAAIGIHAEHPELARIFVIVAVLQLGVGLLALIRPTRLVASAAVVINGAAVVGWFITRVSGISWVNGLESAEAPRFADTACALLGIIAVGAAVSAVLVGWHAAGPLKLLVPALAAAALAIPAMVSAGTHVHGHDDASTTLHVHTDGADAALATETHVHTDAAAPVAAAATGSTDGPTSTTLHVHEAAAVAPVPYDPTKPIDLSGVPGVTPEQQAAAENIISVTLIRLPQWSDPAVAEAAGFRSIGDGGTGVEHFVNEVNMSDDVTFDPDHPESLVYDTSKGGRTLVAAMFMLKRGTPLADVPNIGGKLMQWHTHNNLCYNAQGHVAGITDANGNCAAGLVKPVETPMIHVWIVPNKCGPFAALEGIGGGVIPQGEERLCDHLHGDGG